MLGQQLGKTGGGEGQGAADPLGQHHIRARQVARAIAYDEAGQGGGQVERGPGLKAT